MQQNLIIAMLLMISQTMLCAVSRQEFHDTMRTLWNDHGVWSREFVVATLADLPNAHLTAERLFKNQEDIGSALEPYYGQEASKKLTALLKDHIKIAAEVVSAAKKGDSKSLGEQDALWRTNARDISSFLSKANPHLTEKDLVTMMYEHLDLLTQVVTARIKKNWVNDISSYNSYLRQLNHMADALSEAIMKQFPHKFFVVTPAVTHHGPRHEEKAKKIQ